MRRLSEEQRRIREQVEQIAREDQQKKELLGRLDQTQREMKEVEEALGSGQSMGDLEEKQTRILSRLLDSSRSVNRRDFEPQRESAPGQDIVRASPGELPAELLRENDRLRLDLLKAEADRYPTRYRAYVEAYLRSLNGSRR
jgi:small-conductance mechanosensitive channel